VRSVILGTAGHIDHGKTTLVKALTGVDTDRLEEERRRGISIELGFARLDVGDIRFGIVDVPGHERFVKNMLAGAGGIDLVMLVVAADEGVMPQTREHLDIIDFLQVEHGVVALTKCDLVDEETRDIAHLDVQEALQDTVLEHLPIIPVSGSTGEGIDELKAALVDASKSVQPRPDDGPFRLAIDRVFTMEGFGTVVTGTGSAGSVKVGDRLDVVPLGETVRIRRVQVHGKDAERAVAGQRTALAVHGVDKERLQRGQQVVSPGSLTPSSMLDVRIRVSPRWVRPVRNRERVRFHLASAEDLARVVLLDREELAPGEDCLAQIRLETPVVPAVGDRFVLRSYSPMHAMAGGTIVDAHPDKHHRFRPEEVEAIARREGGGPIALLLEAVAEKGLGGVKPKDLVTATSLSRDEVDRAVAEETASGNLRVTGGGRVVSEDEWRVAARTVLEEGTRFRERHPLRWGIPREELRGIVGGQASPTVMGELLEEIAERGEIVLAGDKVRVGGGEVVFEGKALAERERIDHAYLEAGCSPPDVGEVIAAGSDRALGEEVVGALVDLGDLKKVTEEIYYHREAWERAHAALLGIHARDGGITVGAFRDELGISRKYAVPLLEMFDALKVTRRNGDVRALINQGSS
jgi:selenocysteine-specific elongation factor